MRKHGAAFADNAQAAPALPDKHTRKQKECGGGSSGPARGPQPHHRGARSWLGVTRHPAPGHSSGVWVPPSQSWHPQSAARGRRAASGTACSTATVSTSPSLAGGKARHGRDGQLLPAGCSPPAAVPPRPGRGGQGPVPSVLTQQDSNGGGTNLGLSRTSCSSTEAPWSRQSRAAQGGQAQPLGSIPSSCSHPWPSTPQDSPTHILTGDRLSLPAAWSLPRSSLVESGSHRGTASLSSVGGDARGQQGEIRLPSLPQPCWASQTWAFPHPASSAFTATGADKPCPHHSPSTALL